VSAVGAPMRGAGRLADDRYCAPCGWLYCLAKDAGEHRREVHPEQARFERPAAETLTGETA